MSTASTTEVLELLREATKVFQATDEIETIKQAKSTFEETKDIWSQQETDARTLIREWAEKVESRENQILLQSNEEEYKRTVSLLDTEKDSAISQWAHAEKTCESIAARIAKLKVENDDLKRKVEQAQATPVDLVPKQKHAISLYAHLTNIRWDYENESMVQGQVRKESDGNTSIKAFSLDPKAHSKFFITNYLWDSL